jgi:hypothetical protein
MHHSSPVGANGHAKILRNYHSQCEISVEMPRQLFLMLPPRHRMPLLTAYIPHCGGQTNSWHTLVVALLCAYTERSAEATKDRNRTRLGLVAKSAVTGHKVFHRGTFKTVVPQCGLALKGTRKPKMPQGLIVFSVLVHISTSEPFAERFTFPSALGDNSDVVLIHIH